MLGSLISAALACVIVLTYATRTAASEEIRRPSGGSPEIERRLKQLVGGPFKRNLGPYDYYYYRSRGFEELFRSAGDLVPLLRAGLSDPDLGWEYAKIFLLVGFDPDQDRLPEFSVVPRAVYLKGFVCGLPKATRAEPPYSGLCEDPEGARSDPLLAPALEEHLAAHGISGGFNQQDTPNLSLVTRGPGPGMRSVAVEVKGSIVSDDRQRLLAEVYRDFGGGPLAGNQTWLLNLTKIEGRWTVLAAWLATVE